MLYAKSNSLLAGPTPVPNKAITLAELLIAVSLLGLLSVGIWSIDRFSRHHLITSDKHAQAQNQASVAMEHMAKNIGKAIGNRAVPAENPVSLAPIGGDTAIRVYIDSALDGSSPGDGRRGTEGDHWIAYRYRASTGQIWYYADYPASPREVIAKRISAFTPGVSENYVSIFIKSKYDYSSSAGIDNPEVEIKTNIRMPAVSLN